MTRLPPTTDGHPARRGVVPPPENPRTPASISANDLLVVPKNPISGGDAIPVSFRITSDWLKKNVKAPRSTTPGKPVQLSAAAVDLKWNDTLIATFTLGKSAREITGLSKDIQFATRLKIKTEQNKTTTGALTATAKLIPAGESELPRSTLMPTSKSNTVTVVLQRLTSSSCLCSPRCPRARRSSR